MGFLCMPRASRKMQRTLKNLRVSLLCFILTFLMLRNTIGAGKFGTPAQDFEEIRQHLHYVGLNRRHFRVLAEAVEEEEKPPMLTLERRSPLPELVFKEEQGNALNVRQRSAPLLTSRPLQGGLLEGNVAFHKDLAGSRIKSWDEERKTEEALAHGSYGGSRVLLLTGLQSSSCNNPAGEHFLLKSLNNKVHYSTLHGLEISLSLGGLDPEMSKLSLLQRTMLNYPHVEWLWWMPNEALFTDMSFKLPMHSYTKFNLVLLGSDDKTHHQKSLINLNTDTFLIRNCQWSIDLLRARPNPNMGNFVAEGDQADRLLTNSLIRGPHLGASDQSALISLLNVEKESFANKIYEKHSAVLRGNWHDAVEKFERIVKRSGRGIGDERLPFVTHFLGCNVCQDKESEMCAKKTERAFVFAEKQSMQSYVLQHRSLDSN